MAKERKEYLNRQDFPLVNPPITYGEYEARRFAQGLRKCDTCEQQLDTADIGIVDCFNCYSENQRKGN